MPKTNSKDIRLLFLLLLPFVEPQIFKTEAELEIIDSLFAVIKSLSCIFIILIYLKKYLFHISKGVYIMLAVQIITFISTIHNKGSLTRFLGPALISVVMIMIGELILDSDWKRFLLHLEKLLSIFFLINVVTLIFIFFKIEPFSHWSGFLGIENRWIYFFLPWIIISFLNSYIKFHYINSHAWRIYAISTIFLLAVWSLGASLALLSFLGAFLIKNINHKKNTFFMKAKTMYCIMIIVNILLIFGFTSNIFDTIITSFLKKSVTLSGRTLLWEVVLRVLSDKPFLGMGVQSHEFDLNYFFVQTNFCEPCRVNHPHNHFLNVAYHGGILSLIIFGYLIFYVMKQLDKIQNKEIANILYCGSLAIFVASLVDTLDFSLFYLFIPFVLYFSHTK